MASIRLIRKRIKAAKNISQITRAMEMVAASKMKKAQQMALLGRPYQEKIYEAVFELYSGITVSEVEPRRGSTSTTLVVLISTNKGLCGGLNSNLFRYLETWLSHEKGVFITLGKKGEAFVVRTKRRLLADFSLGSFLESVPAITQLFSQEFMAGKCDSVYLVFNKFVSSLKQEPVKRRILPLKELSEVEPRRGSTSLEEARLWREFLVEPSVEEVLNSLLPHYLEIQLRGAILEAEACEHSARMLAMKNASDNAKSLIYDFTLEYNRVRQEKITYEIADMVTARIVVQ